mgnify:CR=1 FL=1
MRKSSRSRSAENLNSRGVSGDGVADAVGDASGVSEIVASGEAVEVGELVTSFEMAGASLTFTWLNDELEDFWKKPTYTPGYKKGTVSLGSGSSQSNSLQDEKKEISKGSSESQECAKNVLKILQLMETNTAQRADEYGLLDSYAGDGDHGIGMARGAHAAATAAKEYADAGAGAGSTLEAAADSWSDKAGGTSGIIWGIILREIGKEFGDSVKPSAQVVASAIARACAEVTKFGKAQIGDKTLVDVLIPFSDYAFNRAHSAGYGVVSFWTAYLKANYPTEYMAALLTSVRDDKDKSALYLSECRRMGIKVLPPDVNESDAEYTPRGKDIRFGLAAIRNVGEGVVASVKASRESKGAFTSFGNFLAKVDANVCNKKTIESLIKAGAFDSLEHPRKGLMAIHLEAIDSVIETKRAEAIGQFDLFGGDSITQVAGVDIDIPATEWDKSTLLTFEREMLGLYVSDHPLLGVEHVLRSHTDMTISQLLEDGPQDGMVTIGGLITGIQRKVSRQGASWAVVNVEDLEGAIEVLFFSNTYNQYALSLTEDRVVVVRGRFSRTDEQVRFTALEMKMPDISAAPMGPLLISLPAAQVTPPIVDRIKEILRSHPGKREVHLQVVDQQKSTTMKIDALVTSSPSLSADLKAILGPDCLVRI